MNNKKTGKYRYKRARYFLIEFFKNNIIYVLLCVKFKILNYKLGYSNLDYKKNFIDIIYIYIYNAKQMFV